MPDPSSSNPVNPPYAPTSPDRQRELWLAAAVYSALNKDYARAREAQRAAELTGWSFEHVLHDIDKAKREAVRQHVLRNADALGVRHGDFASACTACADAHDELFKPQSSVDDVGGNPLLPMAGDVVSPRPLNDLHQAIQARAQQFSKLRPGPIFGISEALDYLPGAMNLVPKDFTHIRDFKREWVSHFKDVILDAAAQNDLPPELLGSVAHTEAGGNAPPEKVLTYDLRRAAWFLFKNPSIKTPEETSQGEIAIQPRRAAEALGLDWSQLDRAQRAQLFNSMRDPVQNIYFAAKHLSDLRSIVAPGVDAEHLTPKQIAEIGSRYNAGPEASAAQLKKNEKAIDYGRNIARKLEQISVMLGTYVPG